jgi:hypothetical protein
MERFQSELADLVREKDAKVQKVLTEYRNNPSEQR